jgi:hypothetical protein
MGWQGPRLCTARECTGLALDLHWVSRVRSLGEANEFTIMYKYVLAEEFTEFLNQYLSVFVVGRIGFV